MDIKPLDFGKITTYPLRERKNRVRVSDFAKKAENSMEFKDFVGSLPNLLAGCRIREFVDDLGRAVEREKAVIFGIGGHVIKCGLSPMLIQMMEKGVITAVAMNGAAAIHDFEIAMIGQTSEDVAENLELGTFGMAEETGAKMNRALSEGMRQGIGAGRAFGEEILREDMRYKEHSVLARALELGVPVMVHIAVGTDIIHQHPKADGAAIGATSFTDFRLLCSAIKMLNDGGVFINFGSAVIIPEVFLKALAVARNVGGEVKNFVTANFDMLMHYRPLENVVRRPTAESGKGYNFVGHHEILFPLLYWMVMSRIGSAESTVGSGSKKE